MTQQDAAPGALPVMGRGAIAPTETVAPPYLASSSTPLGGTTDARRATVWLVWALWAFTLLLLIGYLLLRLYWYARATTPGITLPPSAVAPSLNTLPRLIAELFGLVGVLAFATLGALIVSRARARARRIGWLYCAISLGWAADGFSGVYAIMALLVAPGSLPGGLAFAWIQSWTWLVVVGLLFVFLPLLYPTGRLLSRRWRPVAVCAIVLFGGGTVLAAVEPGRLGNHLLDFPLSIANPLGITALGPVYLVIVPIVEFLLLILILLAAASLLLRLRHARGEERQQVKWFAYVVAFLIAQFLTTNLLSFFPGQAVALTIHGALYLVTPFLGALLPLLTGLAILKYRLFDIDLLINRTLVYGALSACVVGLYVLVVGGLGALFQSQGSLPLSILATGLVALLFQPLRVRLQQAVNRLMYGERDDPYTLLTRLGSRLDVTLAPAALLPTIVQTVREALRLPYVAIARGEGKAFMVAAAAGEPMDDALRLPLTYQGRIVGQFLLGARAPGETFSPADQRLLDGLARQVGVAIHAAQLTADLQRARMRLVMAGEEERRRLRRDLHDGLGPALAAQSLKLEAARDLILTSPEQAFALLSALLDESQRSITDIRRLVYALRPPELDELGLIAAIRAQVARYAHTGLAISLEAPDSLPPLPAAVEVAAYRIAQEGLTNVVRHAAASTCGLRLACAGAGDLCLEIVDNGRGLPLVRSTGVGLISMRERAEELGGDCAIESANGGGTRVSVRLPCGVEWWGRPEEEGTA